MMKRRAMSWIVNRIKWIMLISGALTCTMLYAAVAPQAALHSTFGQTLEGPIAEIVVRNWGALITLVGVMLIYGAYRPASRPFIVSVAGVSKLIFIGLVIAQGSHFLGQQVVVAAAIDLVAVILFTVYLVSARQSQVPT
jgi:hypothetical protein